MNLRVEYQKDGEVIEELWGTYSLEEAEEIVCNWVDDGATDWGKIYEAKDLDVTNDVLLFEYSKESPDGRGL